MSIIEEALRRVQDPGLPKLPTQPAKPAKTEKEASPIHPWSAAPPGSPLSVQAPVQSTKALLAVAFAVIALTLVLIIGAVFWMGRESGAANPAVLTPVSTAPINSQMPAQAPDIDTSSPSVPKQLLSLNGVVEGSGKPYAVINGQIVGVGEQIQGTTLTEIHNGVVKLRKSDDSEIVLRIPTR